jgi:predicted site-specific integrase-resolvase
MQGTPEFAKKWGVKQSTVSKWCREGKIPGAEQDGPGKPWRIPDDAKPPKTFRGKNK